MVPDPLASEPVELVGDVIEHIDVSRPAECLRQLPTFRCLLEERPRLPHAKTTTADAVFIRTAGEVDTPDSHP
jgi:hypothetical protein